MKTSVVQYEYMYSDSSTKEATPSIQDILKFQDATAALKHLQEILGESKFSDDFERESETEAASYVSNTTRFSQQLDSSSSMIDFGVHHEDNALPPTHSFLGSHGRQQLLQRRHSADEPHCAKHSCFIDTSENQHFDVDLDLNEEFSIGNHRPAISRELSFQEEGNLLTCHYCRPNYSYHNEASFKVQRDNLFKHKEHKQEHENDSNPHKNKNKNASQNHNKEHLHLGSGPCDCESFREFEFVFFDNEINEGRREPSTSPQMIKVETPTDKHLTPSSTCNSSYEIIRARTNNDRKGSVPITEYNQRPPTPGSNLVEQLQMDRPLMEAIAKKHKRGYYKCTHCPKTFSNIFEYASHMDEFEIKREYKCPFALCPWKILGLPRRADLRRHCAIQHKHELPQDLKEQLNLNDEAYPALKCPHRYCDKVFHRRDAYNRHITIVHDKLNSRFNKRLFQTLADCPYDQEADRHKYVKLKMKSKKQQQQQQYDISE